MWNGAWNPYGLLHVDWCMDSIWNSTWIFNENSLDSPYGIHSGYGMEKWLGTQPKNSPYGIHGLGVESTQSIWNPYGITQGV